MPSVLSSYAVETYNSATRIPDYIWQAMIDSPCNSNIMLPHAESAKAHAYAGQPTEGIWIACITSSPSSPRRVDFILSCTSNHLGANPIFIFTTIPPAGHASEDVTSRLTSMAHALLRSVPVERVFSVFAPDHITRTFTSVWTDITGISLAEDPEYYAAKISYCTRSSFRPRSNSSLPDVQYELRLAREDDASAVAQLCYGFAIESPPFTLTMQNALREASMKISNGQLWVHEIRSPGQSAEIASIVAVTRTSSTVAAITKVYTNPRWRKRGCAERLVRKVCKHLLKTKDSVVLYVAHENPAAAKVYHRVGFLGLGPETEPVDGVDDWLELGFDRSRVVLGHW
ncbi:hypothetical protein BDW22DRAFT_79618 [Trametopsis cervina]|nr:hypothetical protein BDW22DRAFT_79618 [Trametopsis cervina]